MYVIVDRVKCTGLGICESIAPDTFEIADDGSLLVLREEVSEDERAKIEEAVQACPTAALRIGHAATALDPDAHTLRIGDEFVEYSALLIATGWLAGSWPNPLFDEARMRLENWTGAAEQGAAAARNALGLSQRKPYETVPYVWSDWYDNRLQFVGRTASDEVRVVLGELDGPTGRPRSTSTPFPPRKLQR